jgi:pyrophosphatase PpaX
MTSHARRFGVVLFDFDGTLADTTELFVRTFRHALGQHLGSVPPDESWRPRFGMPLDVQLGHYARSPEELARWVESFREFQEANEPELMTPFPGAVQTVAALAGRGVKLGMVTSKHRRGAIRAAGICGLTDYFPVIVTPEDVPRGKPHPDPVLRALELLGADPGDALFVGDSPWDMAAGRAAGTATAAAVWGAFPREVLEAEHPDFLLWSVEEVLGIV